MASFNRLVGLTVWPGTILQALWVSPVNSLGPRGVYLVLASIQCFILVSIAPESPDSKSAGCEAVTLREIDVLSKKVEKL